MLKPADIVFNRHAREYDAWFETHAGVYHDQLSLLQPVIPDSGRGLEIGVGSGRFAAPLGISCGIDPAPGLLSRARFRGVETVLGVGESLPYRSAVFDYALMMTVICFMDDLLRSISEAFRVIRPGGVLVIGFLEVDGEIARRERSREPAGRFFRHARFPTLGQVTGALAEAGFSGISVQGNHHGLCIVMAQKE